MKRIVRKIGTTMLAVAVGAGLMLPSAGVLVSTAAADEEAGFPAITSPELSRTKDKGADKLDENKEIPLTISVPSVEQIEHNRYDVVFVVDCSSLLRKNSEGMIKSINTMIDDLKKDKEQRGAQTDIHIGMVGFNNSSKIVFDLTNIDDITDSFEQDQIDKFKNVSDFYNHYRNGASAVPSEYGSLVPWVAFGHLADEYVQTVRTAGSDAGFIEKYPENNPSLRRSPTGEGTNLQQGIIAGKAMLDSDTANTMNSSKYLVVVTDGASFYWNNDKGVSASTVGWSEGSFRLLGNMDSNNPSTAPARVDEDAFTKTTGAAVADGDAFGEFISKKGADIEGATNVNAKNAFDYSFTKADYSKVITSSGALVNDSSNSGTATWPDGTHQGKTVGETAYKSADHNDTSKPASLGNYNSFDDYPYTNMERGTYFAAKEMAKMRNAGYNFVTIGFEYGSEDGAGNDKPKLQRLLSYSFLKWMANLGEFIFYDGNVEKGYKHGDESKTVTHFVEELDAAAQHIFFPVKAGSVLYDEMGSEDGVYAYELVTPDDSHKLADCFKLVTDSQTLTATAAGDNTWTFANSKGKKIATLTYYPDGTKSDAGKTYKRCYKLEVHETLQALTLTYNERLVWDEKYETENAGKEVSVNTKLNGTAEIGDTTFDSPEITIEDEMTPLASGDDIEVSPDDPEEEETVDPVDDESDTSEVKAKTSKKKKDADEDEEETDAVETSDELAVGLFLLLALSASAAGIAAASRRRSEED